MKIPFWRNRRRDEELNDEIQSHLKMAARDRMERGESLADADRYARRQMGNIEMVKEATRDVWGLRWLADATQDMRYGLRVLVKSPGVTLLAVCAFALGIGANAAIFSVADPLLLRPEPFPNLGRLVLIFNRVVSVTNENSMYPADLETIRSQSTSFDQVAAYSRRDANLTGAGDPERVQAARVTTNFFDTLGVAPLLGRGFTSEEGTPGHDRETILSYGLWRSRFAGDPSIIGKETQIDGRTYTIIGVMGKEFQYPMTVELWEPFAFTAADQVDRVNNYLFPVGLLKPGVSVSRASQELESIGERIAREFPRSNGKLGIRVVPFRTYATDELTHNFMLLLLSAVGFVLLIACANVANLQLARSAGRGKEIAVRIALGASRWRVVRQLLTESLILALAGAAAGLLLAEWAITLIVANTPAELGVSFAGWNRIALDWRAIAFTTGVAVVAGIIAGIAPAVGHSRPNLTNSLQEGGRSGSGRASHRLRSVLVVAEVASSLVLLVGAGLLTKGFIASLSLNEKFSPQTLLTANVSLRMDKYPDQPKLATFYQQALAQLTTIPGIESAAIATAVPDADSLSYHPYTGEGNAWTEDQGHIALAESISGNYLKTLGLPLLRGREFTDADGPNTQRVAIISRLMAERYWPGQDAIGRRIKQGQPDSKQPWLTIVGIASDAKYNPYFEGIDGVVYVPFTQNPDMNATFLLRTRDQPLNFVSALRAKIRDVDVDQPIYGPKTLAETIHEQLIGISFIAVVMGVLGLIALVLASSGVYGVMAQSVTERTHEIGIRIALGAEPRQVLRWIVGRGIRPAVIGLVIGLTLAFVLARLLGSLIFGVSATDPVIFGGTGFLLALVAFAACYIPAQRTLKVDPMVALRHE